MTVRRISSSGDFGLVLVHAAAHIQVDPSDMSNDLDPRFTQYFHRALKVLTQGATRAWCFLSLGAEKKTEAGNPHTMNETRSGNWYSTLATVSTLSSSGKQGEPRSRLKIHCTGTIAAVSVQTPLTKEPKMQS